MNPAYVVLAGSLRSFEQWRRSNILAPHAAIMATERSMRGAIIHSELTEIVELESFLQLPLERRITIRELVRIATWRAPHLYPFLIQEEP